MKCRFPETRLALYIEGDLSLRQARAAERHLQACAECRSAAAELRAGLDTLKTLARPDFTGADFDDLQQRVSEGLRAAAASPNRALRWERAALGGLQGLRGFPALAGAAAVAVLMMWLLAAPQPSRVETPPAPAAAAAIGVAAVASADRTALTMPGAPEVVRVNRSVVPAPQPSVIKKKEAADAAQTPAMPLPDQSSVEPRQPLLVKLFTDDPNVVIYWLVEPQGGADELSSF